MPSQAELTLSDKGSSQKKRVYLSVGDVYTLSRSMTIAIAIKYKSQSDWVHPEAHKALLDQFTDILRAECSLKLLNDLGINAEEDKEIKECTDRLMHGASRCTCGNHHRG